VSTDRARHAVDAVNVHFAALGIACAQKWVAIRLSDGKSDGVLYERRDEAIRHQFHENFCAYLCIPLTGVNAEDMEKFLVYCERLYAAGMRPMQNNDVREEFVLPTRREGFM
jgi:hypothetical protein